MNQDKVLIIRRHGSIGDMLMMTPALRELGKNVHIDMMVQKDYCEVFYNLSYIKNIFPLEDNPKFEDYNQVIDLTDFEFNYEQVFQPEIYKTKIELFGEALNLNVSNNLPDIVLSKSEKLWAEKFFQENQLVSKKTILFAIKSANPTRDWPIERWKLLINSLKKLNYNLIVIDKNCIWEDKEVIFFNNLSIRELFALVFSSDFIICNDSGLLHIGGAFGKKTLGIFGPTDPKVRCIYPNSYEIHNNIGLEPCWYKRSKEGEYFKAINVEDVERKFLEILQNG